MAYEDLSLSQLLQLYMIYPENIPLEEYLITKLFQVYKKCVVSAKEAKIALKTQERDKVQEVGADEVIVGADDIWLKILAYLQV